MASARELRSSIQSLSGAVQTPGGTEKDNAASMLSLGSISGQGGLGMGSPTRDNQLLPSIYKSPR